MAEISGRVELRSDKRKGKMTITIRSESGMEKEHHVPRDRHLNVHTGDIVEAGDALTDGPLVPHDILRIKGEEALQRYLHRRNSERLSFAEREHQRQARRDHHFADDAKGRDRLGRRQHVPAGRGGRQVRLPQGKRPLTQQHQDRQPSGDVTEAAGRPGPRQEGTGPAQREGRGAGRHARQGQEAQARHGQDAAAGHYQGLAVVGQLHCGRQLPGNNKGVDGGGAGR